jgi:hypothetical protein
MIAALPEPQPESRFSNPEATVVSGHFHITPIAELKDAQLRLIATEKRISRAGRVGLFWIITPISILLA